MSDQPEKKHVSPSPEPLSPFAQAQLTLTEGFPTVEANVIRAVLIASKGDLESAFNGLLSLTDSDYVVDESPFNDPQPVSRSREDVQVREDEKLARRLAAAVKADGKRSTARNSTSPSEPIDDRSFFDEDLPQLKENFTKGFNETKDKVNTWIENFRKKESTSGVFGAVGGFLGGNNSNQPRQQQKPKIYDDEPDQIDVGGIKLSGDNDEPPPAHPSRPEDASKSNSSGESNNRSETPSTPSSNKILLKADKPVEDESFLVSDSDEEEESDKKSKK